MNFSDEDKDRIKDVIEAPDSLSFGQVCKIGGIDVANDLRYADLQGCDFSNDDMRGWDLTGADLRNAKGVGVIWDKTTILTGANIEGSFFEVEP